LYRVNVERVAGRDRIRIPIGVRRSVGEVLVRNLLDAGHRVLAVSVSSDHAHILVELPEPRAVVKQIIGDAKGGASRQVRKQLPGRVWSAGGEYKLVRTKEHLRCALRYILRKQGADSWTWSFRERPPRGREA
jgi:REP element-mobilizing transposase RayT